MWRQLERTVLLYCFTEQVKGFWKNFFWVIPVYYPICLDFRCDILELTKVCLIKLEKRNGTETNYSITPMVIKLTLHCLFYAPNCFLVLQKNAIPCKGVTARSKRTEAPLLFDQCKLCIKII